MYEWPRLIQGMVDEIDRSILAHEEETLTLQRLSRDMGYSAYHATRKFREIAGMPLRDYLRRRRLRHGVRAAGHRHAGTADVLLFRAGAVLQVHPPHPPQVNTYPPAMLAGGYVLCFRSGGQVRR